jgi:hypothetical protein
MNEMRKCSRVFEVFWKHKASSYRVENAVFGVPCTLQNLHKDCDNDDDDDYSSLPL